MGIKRSQICSHGAIDKKYIIINKIITSPAHKADYMTGVHFGQNSPYDMKR